MDAFINERFHREFIQNPDPVKIAEALKTKDGRHLAEEFLEGILPVPFTDSESATEDLVYLLMQKILFPFM